MTVSTSSVRVAVRVRPLTENEKTNNQNNIISFNEQQIILNNERSFTFDHVFSPLVSQEDLYNISVIPLLNKFIEGYNSTILAYGQTGSGKTYSMGIGMNTSVDTGIVPRFIHSLFENLNSKIFEHFNYSYQVCVSFLELHNEDLVDLLNPKKEGLNLTIREDIHGNICWSGVKEEVVQNPAELISMLQKGSIARTTASTDMNTTSSRSHAIFSVILKQTIVPSSDDTLDSIHTTKKLISKFHFVDLAGSERLKRTNAVGDRAKEGISINSGLLALGNVISALGDESRRVSHIPYRDSKLTRLLQDSLGGNSQTLMIACASPAESNLNETLNTLKYANRARNIKNRVVVNQEMNESEKLKQTIIKLKEELKSSDDFLHAVNHEMDSLKIQVGSLSYTLNETVRELASVKCERDRLLQNTDIDLNTPNDAILKQYATTIELLKSELIQSQKSLEQQQKANALLVDQNKALPVDHIDNSLTLIGSPSHSIKMNGFINSQRPDKRKNKKHRVGNKRSKNSRQKPMSSSHSTSSKIDTITSSDNTVLQEAIKKIEKETEILESAKISMLSSNNTPEKMDIQWNDMKEDEDTNPIPPFRRRTIDIIPMGAILQNDQLTENKKLLQKLTKLIESKHLVVRQLEKSEKLRIDQVGQLNRKVDDLTSKKNQLTSQYKRELNDLRHQYECKFKKIQTEQQALKKKHMQLMNKSDQMRNHNQSVSDQLNKTIEKLTHEKKKMIKRLKLESDRAKEKHTESEREITKLKRQETQINSQKKKLERDIYQQKVAFKRSTEEIVALNSQLKQIAAILKKVISNQNKNKVNKDLTDKALLAKAAACANVRGHLVKQNVIKKSGGKFKVSSLQQHVFQKKNLIQRAITLYVKSQSNAKITEELNQKRDRLLEEQRELLAERQLVINEENKTGCVNINEPQYMDERIDLITLQLDTITQQISRFNEEVNNLDDDENWTDVADNELRIGIMDDTDSLVAYETALSLIRSLEADEARLVSESLMEDLISLKTKYQTNVRLTHHLNYVVYSLQMALVQMRRAGVTTSSSSTSTIFNTNDVRAIGQDIENETTSTIASISSTVLNESSFIDSDSQLLSPLDTVFIKVIHSPVNIRCGLVLPK